jgi:hypothetical protein
MLLLVVVVLLLVSVLAEGMLLLQARRFCVGGMQLRLNVRLVVLTPRRRMAPPPPVLQNALLHLQVTAWLMTMTTMTTMVTMARGMLGAPVPQLVLMPLVLAMFVIT